MLFRFTVYDLYEGDVSGFVVADNQGKAEEEAMIAASERGCTMIEEVEVCLSDAEKHT